MSITALKTKGENKNKNKQKQKQNKKKNGKKAVPYPGNFGKRKTEQLKK